MSATTISGTVFEDVNYGGGAGRSLAASGGVGVPNVRVEFYQNNGNYEGNATTNASGQYTYSYNGSATRRVRVVNGTVASGRANGAACTNCVGIQTFRVEAPSGLPVAITNEVGGRNPALSDFASRITNFPAATSTQIIQSWSAANPVNGNSVVAGINFGFNFDTIVNTRDALTPTCTPSAATPTYYPCQGGLRQFIINSNALGGSLTQSGFGQIDAVNSPLPSGYETSIFMIPNGAANPGQNTSYTNQLIGGVAIITLTSALPALTGANTRLDATTQTVNVGNTNALTVGSGGLVGVDNISLPAFQRPEVQLQAGDTAVALNAAGQGISGIALAQGYISTSGANAVVRSNLVGFTASGASDSGGATYGILFTGANALIRGNYVAVNNSGIRGESPGTGGEITFNEVARPLVGHSDTYDGILVIGSAANVDIVSNLVRDQRGGGIEIGFGTGTMTNVTIANNTARNNGYNSGSTASSEPLGIVAYSYTGSGVVISRNRIENNAGPGLLINAADGTTISQNRFSNNGNVAIDLDPRALPAGLGPNSPGTPNGVTVNDNGDTDSGPNGLLNYPVITAATIANGEFSLAGFARPGSTIELYVAQPDAAGFGEGLTYVATLIEGTNDFDAGTGSYSGTVNGLNQGGDTTNRFLFRGAVPPGVADTVVLTSTATFNGQTSEFGGNVTVTSGADLIQTKSVAVYSDPFNNTTNPKSIPGAFQLYTLRVTNQGPGVVDNNTLAIVDAAPANTTLYVGDIGGAGAGPIRFVNGTTSSNLTYAFTALDSATDNLDFSTDAVNWNYTPVPDAQGCDPAVRYVRVRPLGTMAAAIAGNPYFEIQFRVMVE